MVLIKTMTTMLAVPGVIPMVAALLLSQIVIGAWIRRNNCGFTMAVVILVVATFTSEGLRVLILLNSGQVVTARPFALALLVVLTSLVGLSIGYRVTRGNGKPERAVIEDVVREILAQRS